MTYLIILLVGAAVTVDQPPPVEFADMKSCKRAADLIVGDTKIRSFYRIKAYCAPKDWSVQ